MSAATMSTDHTLWAPEGFMLRNGYKRNNDAIVHIYAHRISKTSRQQFSFGRVAILRVRISVAFGNRIYSSDNRCKSVSLFRLLIVTHVTCRKAINGKLRIRKLTTNIIYYRKPPFKQQRFLLLRIWFSRTHWNRSKVHVKGMCVF